MVRARVQCAADGKLHAAADISAAVADIANNRGVQRKSAASAGSNFPARFFFRKLQASGTPGVENSRTGSEAGSGSARSQGFAEGESDAIERNPRPAGNHGAAIA